MPLSKLGKTTEHGRERIVNYRLIWEREISALLVHSPKRLQQLDWVRWKPGATCYFRIYQQETGIGTGTGTQNPSAMRWGVDAPNGLLTTMPNTCYTIVVLEWILSYPERSIWQWFSGRNEEGRYLEKEYSGERIHLKFIRWNYGGRRNSVQCLKKQSKEAYQEGGSSVCPGWDLTIVSGAGWPDGQFQWNDRDDILDETSFIKQRIEGG